MLTGGLGPTDDDLTRDTGWESLQTRKELHFLVLISFFYFLGSWLVWGRTIGGTIFDVRIETLDGAPPANTGAVRSTQPAGAQWTYSGGGYVLTQLALSDVSGLPFAALAERGAVKRKSKTGVVFDGIRRARSGDEKTSPDPCPATPPPPPPWARPARTATARSTSPAAPPRRAPRRRRPPRARPARPRSSRRPGPGPGRPVRRPPGSAAGSPRSHGPGAGLGGQALILKSPFFLANVALSVLVFTAMFTGYTYLAEMLEKSAGIAPAHAEEIRDVAKFVVFDECWKFLTDETASSIVAELFRTGRKWNASTWSLGFATTSQSELK